MKSVTHHLDRWLIRVTEFGIAKRAATWQLIANFTGSQQKEATIVFAHLRDISRKRKKKIRMLWADVVDAIDGGASVSAALAPHIPPDELQPIAAADADADHANAFAGAAYIATIKKRVRGTLVRTLAYPLLPLLSSLVFFFYAGSSMLPLLTRVTEVEQWPAYAKAAHDVSQWLVSHALVAAIVAVAAGIAITYSLKRWPPGPLRNILDRYVTPWSTYSTVQSVTFLISLGALMRRMAPEDAVAHMRTISAPWMRAHLKKIWDRLQAGDPLGSTLADSFLPDSMADELDLYDRVDSLEQTLRDPPDYFVDQMIDRITVAARLGELVMYLVAASLAVWILATLYGVGLSANPYGGSIG